MPRFDPMPGGFGPVDSTLGTVYGDPCSSAFSAN